MRSWLAVALAAAIAFATRTAGAVECAPGGRPYIRLTSRVAPPDEIIAKNLERHLRAELGERGIDVCASDALPAGSIADVMLVVEHPAPRAFVATIDIADIVTDKRLSRTIDLARLSPAARLMAVAASTDELLRASWTELQVADAPPPRITPPLAVIAAVRSSLIVPHDKPDAARRVWPPRFELGGGVRATSSFAVPREAAAIAIGVDLWVLSRLALSAGASAERGFARNGLHGSVAADTYNAEVGSTYPLSNRARLWGFDASMRASLGLVSYRASATVGTSTDALDWTMNVGASVSFWLRHGRARWVIGTGIVDAVRSSVGRDVGHGVVTGIRGVGGELVLGVKLAP